MKILFAGTPQIAVPTLETLHESFDVCGVLTNPDSKTGRGKKLTESPVKQTAVASGLRVLQPAALDEGFIEQVKTLEPEILVVVAFGTIFSKEFLDIFPKGALNLHPSKLPLYRGPSPIPAAILAGDDSFGITIQKLSLRMDAGDIVLSRTFPLYGNETTADLTEFSARTGASMMKDAVEQILHGIINPVPQNDEQATYCKLIKKQDARIDWQTHDAAAIHRMARAYYPWPKTHCFYGEKKLDILECSVIESFDTPAAPGCVTGLDKRRGILIQTIEGLIAVTRLQLQSKKAMDHMAFMNGTRGFDGSVLE